MAGVQNNLLVEDDDEDIEISLGTPEPDEEEVKPEREAKKPEADDDERLDADQRDDDDEDDDVRAIDKRGDLTDEQKREMRREQRRLQKERRRRAAAEKDAQIADLQAQIGAIVQQTRQLMAQTTEGQLRTAEEHLRRADAALADAIERGDGRAHSQALEYRDKAREAVTALRGKLGQETQAIRQPPQQPQPQQIDPRMARHFAEFQRKVSWYDPTGRDMDSKIVQAIDSDVAQAGFDPTTPEYWEELEDRVREKLPGKFKTQTTRRGPPMSGREASSAGRASGGGSEAMKIPAALKQNMIEAGIWGDPKKRDAAIKDYLRIRRETERR